MQKFNLFNRHGPRKKLDSDIERLEKPDQK